MDVIESRKTEHGVDRSKFKSDGLVFLDAEFGHTYMGCARAPIYTDMELRVTATGAFYDLMKYAALTAAIGSRVIGGKA